MCFLRIRPHYAPITPPGAAPTITTIYNEYKYFAAPSSPSFSPSSTPPADTLSKTTSAPPRSHLPSAQRKQQQRHKKSLLGGKADAQRVGMADGRRDKSKDSGQKRQEKIAESLELGLELGLREKDVRKESADERTLIKSQEQMKARDEPGNFATGTEHKPEDPGPKTDGRGVGIAL